MAATHPRRLHQATDVIKRCPIWCVEEHTANGPVTDGNHRGRNDIFEGWDYSTGNGTAHASITQLMTNHKPNVYVPIVVEVEMAPAELTSLADDLDRFAAGLRTYAKEHTHE